MAIQPLTFIIQSSAPDRAHYALMMAASNAALGGGVTLFFAMGAAHLIRPEGFASNFLRQLETSGIASVDELLAAIVELDGRVAVCDAALAFEAISASDLRSDIPIEVTGLTDILANVGDGQIIYV